MSALNRLIDILQLTEISPNNFMGESEDLGLSHVFGGQIVAQALSAAMRVIPQERKAHACYVTFLQAGDLNYPLYYQTDILREGKSFSIVNVKVLQRGQLICQVNVAFQQIEEGITHQISMPDVQCPDRFYDENLAIQQLATYLPSPLKEIWQKERAFDVRVAYLNDMFTGKLLPPEQSIWAKIKESAELDERLQQCLLAYFTDFHCILTMLHPHKIGAMQAGLKVATLNHTLYFHRDIDFSDWLLFSLISPTTCGARGFTRGEVFNTQGELLVSYQQEGLIRVSR